MLRWVKAVFIGIVMATFGMFFDYMYRDRFYNEPKSWIKRFKEAYRVSYER